MMALIDLANLANTIKRFPIAKVTAKRITRIGWQGDDRTIPNEVCGLDQQALLRRIRMDINDTSHNFTESNAKPA
jgi:hypothetical protein